MVRRLHRRDQDSQGDWFGVALDSNRDRRTALVFEVNAAGVQKDQLIYNDASGAGVSASINAGHDYNPNDVGYLGRADEQRTYAEVLRRWDRPWGVSRNREWGLGLATARDQAGHTFQQSLNTWAKTDFTNFVSLWGGGGVEDDRELRTYDDLRKKYLGRPSIPWANLGLDTPGNRPWYLRLNTSRSWQEGGPSKDATLFQILKPTSAMEIQLSTSVTRDEGELKWLETPVATPIVGLRRLSQFDQTLRVAYAFSPTFTV